MAGLTRTRRGGQVAALLRNGDRAAGIESAAIDQVEVRYDGLVGEAHGGMTRQSCSRVKMLYPLGTEIRNTRQISICGVEEIDAIARDLDLPEPLDPALLGANLVLSGLDGLSATPPSSRLAFENGAVLTIDVENGPCRHPGDAIERRFPGKGGRFGVVARGRRGLTAWVEREGVIACGERFALIIPARERSDRR